MLDPRDLYCINHRCQQAKGVYEKPFGGINFLIIGDFKQLEMKQHLWRQMLWKALPCSNRLK